MEAALYRKIYLVGALVTFAWLMAFDGFVYSHGNWVTQSLASIATSLLWPVYWSVVRWL